VSVRATPLPDSLEQALTTDFSFHGLPRPR
jgi:hypothetical protein